MSRYEATMIDDAEHQHAHHVAADVAQLAGNIGGLVPSAIGEQDEDHREAEIAAARRRRRGAVADAAAGDDEARR